MTLFLPRNTWPIYLLLKVLTNSAVLNLIEADELLQFNSAHEAAEFYPGYFLIGSDGGGEAFAIGKASGNFVLTPYIGHDEETPIIVGRTWTEFLDYLQSEYC
ncbi:hypothetical protein [Hymenobacter psoromatis]|uniref:hypothetical protein n=1 Tax=Hymenobacter psoromatis TaxID=1484116 RepID=UPI001CBEF92C|nr:hypothetical protein [Hymenobacter psoromatis]